MVSSDCVGLIMKPSGTQEERQYGYLCKWTLTKRSVQQCNCDLRSCHFTARLRGGTMRICANSIRWLRCFFPILVVTQ